MPVTITSFKNDKLIICMFKMKNKYAIIVNIYKITVNFFF